MLSKTEIHDLLVKTQHDVKLALYQLSKLVDNDDFHIVLLPENTMPVDLHPQIPKCFKLVSADYTWPILISIKY